MSPQADQAMALLMICNGHSRFDSNDRNPGGGGGGLLGPIFAGYVPLSSQNHCPIIVIFYGQL